MKNRIDEASHTEFTANQVENEQLEQTKETPVTEIAVLENIGERVTVSDDSISLATEC